VSSEPSTEQELFFFSHHVHDAKEYGGAFLRNVRQSTRARVRVL
jgi:hypothetical protein